MRKLNIPVPVPTVSDVTNPVKKVAGGVKNKTSNARSAVAFKIDQHKVERQAKKNAKDPLRLELDEAFAALMLLDTTDTSPEAIQAAERYNMVLINLTTKMISDGNIKKLKAFKTTIAEQREAIMNKLPEDQRNGVLAAGAMASLTGNFNFGL